MGQSPAPVRTLRELEKKKLDSDSFLIPEADFFRRKKRQFAFYPGLPGSEKLLQPACVQGQLREPRRECLEERHRG